MQGSAWLMSARVRETEGRRFDLVPGTSFETAGRRLGVLLSPAPGSCRCRQRLSWPTVTAVTRRSGPRREGQAASTPAGMQTETPGRQVGRLWLPESAPRRDGCAGSPAPSPSLCLLFLPLV